MKKIVLRYLWHVKKVSIICSKCKNENEKLFTQEESVEILKILGLIETM